MVLRENMIPCQSREAIVGVMSYHDGIIHGYLQHPRLEKEETIKSLSQMILLLDSLIDLEGCQNQPLPLVQLESGKRDEMVFYIQILFREHYTWQGRLVWQNEKQEYVFRSVLELLQLMDEILAELDPLSHRIGGSHEE